MSKPPENPSRKQKKIHKKIDCDTQGHSPPPIFALLISKQRRDEREPDVCRARHRTCLNYFVSELCIQVFKVALILCFIENTTKGGLTLLLVMRSLSLGNALPPAWEPARPPSLVLCCPPPHPSLTLSLYPRKSTYIVMQNAHSSSSSAYAYTAAGLGLAAAGGTQAGKLLKPNHDGRGPGHGFSSPRGRVQVRGPPGQLFVFLAPFFVFFWRQIQY